MAKRNLNSCGCDLFIPFGYSTNFLGITLWYTVICVNCKKKARASTLEKAIEKLNAKNNNNPNK